MKSLTGSVVVDMRGKTLASDSAPFVFFNATYTYSNDLYTSGEAAGNVVNEATDHSQNPRVRSSQFVGDNQARATSYLHRDEQS